MNQSETPSTVPTTKTTEPRVRLVAESEPQPGQVIDVYGSWFEIGRGTSCQLALKNTAISLHHAAILRRDGQVFIRDLSSTNGIFLNGRLLKEKDNELHDGDRLEFPPLRFTVAIGWGDPSPSSLEGLPHWITCPNCQHEGWVSFSDLIDYLQRVSGQNRVSVASIPDALLAACPVPPPNGSLLEDQKQADEEERDSPTPQSVASVVRLIDLESDDLGFSINVSGARFLIGRDSMSHLCLLDSAVSSTHAAILRRGARVYLRDMNSTNGTLVNGELIHNQEVEVFDGDRLEITPFQYSLVIGKVVETPAAPAVSPASQAVGEDAAATSAHAPEAAPTSSNGSVMEQPPATNGAGRLDLEKNKESNDMAQRGKRENEGSTSLLDRAGWTEEGKRDWRGLVVAASTSVQEAPPNKPSPASPKPAQPPLAQKPAPAPVATKVRPARQMKVSGPVLMGLAGFLGLSYLLWGWLSTPPTFAPDVVSRAAAATEAFLYEDAETLNLLAVPGTETDLQAWLALARPKGWRLRVNNRQQPTANIKSEDAKQGTALVYGRFYLKPGVIQTAKADDYLPMVWRKMPDGQWKLDGAETRKATPAATKKMPGE